MLISVGTILYRISKLILIAAEPFVVFLLIKKRVFSEAWCDILLTT